MVLSVSTVIQALLLLTFFPFNDRSSISCEAQLLSVVVGSVDVPGGRRNKESQAAGACHLGSPPRVCRCVPHLFMHHHHDVLTQAAIDPTINRRLIPAVDKHAVVLKKSGIIARWPYLSSIIRISDTVHPHPTMVKDKKASSFLRFGSGSGSSSSSSSHSRSSSSSSSSSGSSNGSSFSRRLGLSSSSSSQAQGEGGAASPPSTSTMDASGDNTGSSRTIDELTSPLHGPGVALPSSIPAAASRTSSSSSFRMYVRCHQRRETGLQTHLHVCIMRYLHHPPPLVQFLFPF